MLRTRVTEVDLINWDACYRQTDKFNIVFPNGADITEENAQKAVDAGLDIGWAASRILEHQAFRVYVKEINLEFTKFMQQLDNLANAPESTADGVLTPEYWKKRDQLFKEYELVKALLIVRLFKEQMPE